MSNYTIENPLHGALVREARLDHPIEMTCRTCGQAGNYRVGLLFFHPPLVAALRAPRDLRKLLVDYDSHVSFTGYVLCDHCGAGGPWSFPESTRDEFFSMLAAAEFRDDPDSRLPFQICAPALFDGTIARSAVDAERHLLKLIEEKPGIAFLWNRLGNVYDKAKLVAKAESAFLKAVEIEPRDAESLHSLGDLYFETDHHRAAEYYHRFLLTAPTGVFHTPSLKRTLVEVTLRNLVEWNVETKGEIAIFPPVSRAAAATDGGKQPAVLQLMEFDTSTRAGIERLIDFVLTPPGERGKRFSTPTRRPFESSYPVKNPRAVSTAATPGRNDACPCGSGRKFKHCCGKR